MQNAFCILGLSKMMPIPMYMAAIEAKKHIIVTPRMLRSSGKIA